MQKYLRYIFNGHLVFVMILALGGWAYYYSNWVKTFKVTSRWTDYGRYFSDSSNKKPNTYFFKRSGYCLYFPLETKLKSYFNRSILLSWGLQGYVLLLVLAALMPMYAKVTGANLNDFVGVFILLVIMKLFNLYISWYVLKYQEVSTSKVDLFIRFIINGVLLYLVIDQAMILLSTLTLLLLIGLFFYYRVATRGKILKWDRLISLERKRLISFYRMANLFTDVPSLSSKVARRKWLDGFLTFIPFKQQSTYNYLYARTFLRANDYVGLLIRLTIIGSIIIGVLSNIWAYLFVTLLFLFMTALQLLPSWKVHEWKIWVSLYPLPDRMRETAVIGWISYFLLVEDIVFVIVLLCKGEWMSALMAIVVGIVFIFGFRGYARKKLKTF